VACGARVRREGAMAVTVVFGGTHRRVGAFRGRQDRSSGALNWGRKR
jgi:hypothetical protein